MTTGVGSAVRLAGLVEAADGVIVESGHRSKRRVCGSIWPRLHVNELPTSRRVTVRVPSGVYVKCLVRLWTDGEFVIASAEPTGRVCGESREASCVFTIENELEAERIALESL